MGSVLINQTKLDINCPLKPKNATKMKNNQTAFNKILI